MGACPQCGEASGLLAPARRGLCRSCSNELKRRQSQAHASYLSAIDKLVSGGSQAPSPEQLRDLEIEAALSEEAAAAEHEAAWMLAFDRLLPEEATYGPETDTSFERLEAAIPLPDEFLARHPDLGDRMLLAMIRSDLPLPKLDEDTSVTVGKGDEVVLECQATLVERIDDYLTDGSGQLIRRKKWVPADSGVLAITRRGFAFIGEVVHRSFLYDDVIKTQAFEHAVHFHPNAYPDGVRLQVDENPEVIAALIGRLRRESQEAPKETIARAFRTWRRWRK
jgi:hypothetical protein